MEDVLFVDDDDFSTFTSSVEDHDFVAGEVSGVHALAQVVDGLSVEMALASGHSELYDSVSRQAFGPAKPSDEFIITKQQLELMKQERKRLKAGLKQGGLSTKEQAVAYLQLRHYEESIKEAKGRAKILNKVVHPRRDRVLAAIETAAEPILSLYDAYVVGTEFYEHVSTGAHIGKKIFKGLFRKKRKFLERLLEKEREVRDADGASFEFSPVMWIGAVMDFHGFYKGTKIFWSTRNAHKKLLKVTDAVTQGVIALDAEINSGRHSGEDLQRLQDERDFLWSKIFELGQEAEKLDVAETKKELGVAGTQALYAGMEVAKSVSSILAMLSLVPGVGVLALSLEAAMFPVTGILMTLGWRSTSGNLKDAKKDLKWVDSYRNEELEKLQRDIGTITLEAAADPNKDELLGVLVGSHRYMHDTATVFLRDRLKDKKIEQYLVRVSEVFAICGTAVAATALVGVAAGGLPSLPFLVATITFGVLSVGTRVGATTLVAAIRRFQRRERYTHREDYIDGLIEQMRNEQEHWDELCAAGLQYRTATYMHYGLLQNYYPASPKNWGPGGWAKALIDDPDGQERKRLDTAFERMLKRDNLRVFKKRRTVEPLQDAA